MTTVSSEPDLRAALLDGGDITADEVAVADLTAPLELTVPGTRVRGGRYRAVSGPAWVGEVSEVELAGMRIEGGRRCDPVYDPAQKLVHLVGTEAAPLHDVVVRDCRIGESRGDAVWLEWCVDSQVRGLIARGLLYSGVMVISGERVAVSGCTIADAPLSPGVDNTYGIAFTDLANTEQARSRDCSAVGNTVAQIDWEGIDTHGGDGILIAANTVLGCPRGIALVTGNGTRTTTVPTRCTVNGNSVTARGMRVPAREGLIFGGLPDIGASATITGNRIDGYQRPFFWGDYIDRAASNVADNNVPMIDWTALDQSDADYGVNSTHPLRYMVDGDVGHLTGGWIRKSGRTGNLLGRLGTPHAWPPTLTWIALAKGSNPAAVEGTIIVYPTGEMRLAYATGLDQYTLPGTGTWRTT